MHRWLGSIATSLIVCTGACDSRMDTCDPLGPAPIEIALGEILGVGEDGRGTIYVVDRVGPTSRVFIEDDGALVRHSVSGEAGGGDSELMAFLVNDSDPPFLVEIESSATGTRMAVLLDPGDTETFEIGTLGEELTVLAHETIADVPIGNLAADVELEYLAELEDGRLFLVSRPSEEWDYEDFRVFFGPVEHLAERQVTRVERAKDGGSTTIELEIGGAAASASFAIVTAESELVSGPATLTISGETHALELLPHAVPENAVFHCLDPA